MLVREEVLLVGLCERKILFRLEIYDCLRQATAKRTGCLFACYGCRENLPGRVCLCLSQEAGGRIIAGAAEVPSTGMAEWPVDCRCRGQGDRAAPRHVVGMTVAARAVP